MASEVYYRPLEAICADGVTRRVMVKAYRYNGSFAADTWFSAPAYVKANGKTVRGYVSARDAEEGGPGLEFRAYLYRKNHAAIKSGKV